MIELTWAQIRDPQFIHAVGSLKSAPLPFKLGYHVSRIVDKIESEAATAHGEFVKLVKKYADLDEESGKYQVKDENEEAWKNETLELHKTSFTIDKRKILATEWPDNATLSPGEILALGPLFTELEVVTAVPEVTRIIGVDHA